MSKCCIGLGKCSYFYLYVLGYIILTTIKRIFFSYDNPFEKNVFRIVLNNHYIVQNTFKNIGFIIFGVIFYFLSKRGAKKKTKKNQSGQQINLIHNTGVSSTYKDALFLILIIFPYTLYIELVRLFAYFEFSFLMFWTSNIAFIIYFMRRFFPQEIYKHKLYSMLFVLIICTILVFSKTFIKTKNDKNIYQIKGIALSIIFIFLFILMACSYCFSIVKIKYYVDFKFISPYKIVILEGILFLIISLIIPIFFEYFGNEIKNLFVFDEIKLQRYYYKNFAEFFNEFSSIKNTKKFYLEIFLMIPFYLLSEFFQSALFIFTSVHLNPLYTLLADNLFFLFSKIIDFALKKSKNSSDIQIFIIDEIVEVIEIIGFCIYLEIIELRFLGLSKNTKKEISERSKIETELMLKDNEDGDSSLYVDNEENETDNTTGNINSNK